MRLIDADKLPYSTVYPADGDTMRSTQAVYASDIRKAPTVDVKRILELEEKEE